MQRDETGASGDIASPAPHATRAAAWQGIAPHRLQRVLAYLEAHLAEPIQLQELATQAHMSVFHFARMFKRATGHTPHRYLTLRRIELAKALLAETPAEIFSVARAVGYKTQAHFTGVFARYVGTTPRAWRLARARAIAEDAPDHATGD